jgi:hypothetical protein
MVTKIIPSSNILLKKLTVPQLVNKFPTFYGTLRFIMVRGIAIPLQAWTGPEGSRRLRLPDFNTIGT